MASTRRYRTISQPTRNEPRWSKDYGDVIVDRVLSELSDNTFEGTKARTRLAELVEGARRSSQMSASGFQESIEDLVAELDIVEYLERDMDRDEPGQLDTRGLARLLAFVMLPYVLARVLRFFQADRDVISWMDEWRRAIEDYLDPDQGK